MGRKNSKARKSKPAPSIEEIIAPPQAQLANGSFRRQFVVNEENGQQALAYVNTNHDPVARWTAAGRLDQRQIAAIDTVRRLWDLVGIRQKLSATYGERTAMSVSVELCSATLLDAKDDLKRIEGYFAGLEPYWNVFQNVCRHGQSAGVAGCELGYGSRASETRAHQIVCFVADIIGTKERI